MTNAEKVFGALKRPGECWHEPRSAAYQSEHWPLVGGKVPSCSECGLSERSWGFSNPDFSTPEGFFWIWDRLKEKEWDIELGIEWPNELSCCFINPTALYSAVLKWVREKKKGA